MTRTRKLLLRSALLALTGTAMFAYYALGGRELFTLASLKEARAALTAEVAAEPIGAGLVYVLSYAAMIGLCLPVGGIMALTGGALFGWWKGALLAILGSTAGATAAMTWARLLARDWVQRRWPEAVARMDRGFERSGGTYLVSLRLAPGIPFVLINVGMGLSPISTRRFAMLSALGGLPGTALFAYAGQRLARVEALGDVLSPALLAALLGLALLPLAGKALAGRLGKGESGE